MKFANRVVGVDERLAVRLYREVEERIGELERRLRGGLGAVGV